MEGSHMLEKRYDHKAVEEGKYDSWKKGGYFRAGDKSKPPFSLVIPPPNVTGKLHLGHVMDTIPDDIIVRYKKMKGFDVLWLPGCDHAGIATQAKVEEKLREQGISRYDLGREKFLETAYLWKEEYASIIHKQWAKLGLSVDYSRERFTLDEGLQKAVKHVFKTLYEEGLIYRGERIINWDPELRTALSNIEVEHLDDEGESFYFSYDIVGKKEKLIVATTRPETMFGDTAVFVNPKDERYKHLIGSKAINPANGEELPIMGDEYVDIEFGTGAMKCTPAHDPNDFALAKKYGFPLLRALDESAHITGLGGKYEGMDRYECRKALVEDIKANGHLVKIEKMVHSVGHSERSGTVVEPMVSKQWFVKMKPLAEAVLKYQESDKAIKFYPDRFKKVLSSWMGEVEDWCISRQLWWGHRIPAYYNDKGEVLVSETDPGEGWHQDEDVLDTWFSSALWPFATMGWPEKSDDLSRYYPTSVLVTGYDIIFFWVSRMVFQGLHFTKEAPFKEVVIHGLIRDEKGRKMSKSLGNGIDPIDVIEKYGTDALRYFISTNSTPGLDMRYIEEKVASSANYLNKIYNAARYCLISLGEDYVPQNIDAASLSVADKAILYRLDKTILEVDRLLSKYEFGQASSKLYDFVYDDYCSSYLESSKIDLSSGKKITKDVIYHLTKSIVLLIYPFAPFIAEEIYLSLPGHKDSIMLEEFPIALGLGDEESSKAYAVYEAILKDVRNFKSTNKIEPTAKIELVVSPKLPFEEAEAYLKRFLFAEKLEVSPSSPEGAIMRPDYSVLVKQDIDPKKLKSNLLSEKERLMKEVARGEGILSNSGFLSKAPKAKVNLEKEKLSKNKSLLAEIESRLKGL